jgi:hypothetical protein
LDFLVNDLSIHGQFADHFQFREAIGQIMKIRSVARQFGRELCCSRNMSNAQVTATEPLSQVIGHFSIDQQRDLLSWLTRYGPFWDDIRELDLGEWFECNGEPVTDHAVGEAAYNCMNGVDRHLVSLAPSDWITTPIIVTWMRDDVEPAIAEVPNHWAADTVTKALQAAPIPIESWLQLEDIASARCPALTFAANAFESLMPQPFNQGVADRLLVRLLVLDKFKGCFDESGQRTAEGQILYNEHFSGKKHWFSDSSDREKLEFKTDLTFDNPFDPAGKSFCTWHGKVKTPQLRIHFTWPIVHDQPLYIAYVGPKLTKD